MADNSKIIDILILAFDQLLFVFFLSSLSTLLFCFFSKRFSILSLFGDFILFCVGVIRVLGIIFPTIFLLTKQIDFSFSFVGIVIVVFSTIYAIKEHKSFQSKSLSRREYRINFIVVPSIMFFIILGIGGMNLGLDYVFSSKSEYVISFWDLFKGLWEICVWCVAVILLAACIITMILKNVYKKKKKNEDIKDTKEVNNNLNQEKKSLLKKNEKNSLINGSSSPQTDGSNIFDWDKSKSNEKDKKNSNSTFGSSINDSTNITEYMYIDGKSMNVTLSTTSALMEEVGNLSVFAMILIFIIIVACFAMIISLGFFLYHLYLNGKDIFDEDTEFLYRSTRIFNMVTSILFIFTTISLFFFVWRNRRNEQGLENNKSSSSFKFV